MAGEVVSAQESSQAVKKLLVAADEVLDLARAAQAAGKPGDALACAMFANEYVRAARAMQDMEDASKAYDERGKPKG